jgi:hypothetical protein
MKYSTFLPVYFNEKEEHGSNQGSAATNFTTNHSSKVSKVPHINTEAYPIT